MARTGQPAVRHVAAVERAFSVLDALADGSELGTNELARRTGINASTVSRLLATLASARYVEHVAETGRYRLSLRFVELGNAVLGRLDLRELARPHLQALVRETGETATLSAPGETDAVTIDFVLSPATIVSVAQVGRPSIGHATAVGKVMLALSAPPAQLGELERFTERTIVAPSELTAELDRVRAQGYATAVEEREEGLSAAAAPVVGRAGELVAILGVQGPSQRLRGPALDAVVKPLLGHALELGASLGGRDA
jgi:DNA-binding IclR family transcriptional regulator